MAKRYVRKKKKRARSGCALWAGLLLAAALLTTILVLSLSSCRKEEPAPAADALWDGSWYEDDLGRIGSDKALVKGMKTFEKRTGSKPFLTLLSDIDPEALDDFAADQYEALFADGDHVLVIYDEWGSDAYYLAARTGEQSALSSEDVSALLSCLENAYGDPANRSYAEAFGAGFAQGAKRASARSGGSGAGLLLALGLLLILLSAVLILLLRKKARDIARMEREDG